MSKVDPFASFTTGNNNVYNSAAKVNAHQIQSNKTPQRNKDIAIVSGATASGAGIGFLSKLGLNKKFNNHESTKILNKLKALIQSLKDDFNDSVVEKIKKDLPGTTFSNDEAIRQKEINEGIEAITEELKSAKKEFVYKPQKKAATICSIVGLGVGLAVVIVRKTLTSKEN